MAQSPRAKGRRTKPTSADKPPVSGAAEDPLANVPPTFLEDVEVIVAADDDDGQAITMVDDGGNVAEITRDADGDITVDFNPDRPERVNKFADNLAELLTASELATVASNLMDAISDDDTDREEWLEQRARGLEMLGLKTERPGMGNVGSGSTAVAGQSTVRDPIMLDAVLRGQANAYAELCPSGGPCKAVNFGADVAENERLAEDLEKDINYYLTTTASEYYPDTRKMLGMTVYASGMFKKVYKCPIRRRPVSESVDGSDLIVPATATDLKNAGRVTQRIDMRRSVMRRMQILGVYRDVELPTPSPSVNALRMKEASISGIQAQTQSDEDQPYTVYECYCELDLPGFEHKEKGSSEPSGLPLPYRVTIEKDSRTILEIRRNWREDDEDQIACIPFVDFPYVTGFGGFYGIGLLHILGNTTAALTAMLREGIDAGMYANFPGALMAAGLSRQKTNEIRVAPGSLAPVDIPPNTKIGDAIMPLPYKDITPGLFSMMGMLRDVGTRLGGSADIPVGEGVQNAPVGTTLAMIEQATKVESSVHKSLHAAQSEELRLLVDLFRDDPEALWRSNRRPALGQDHAMRLDRFKRALTNVEIVPASDPNVSSHMQRLAKAQALKQLTMGNPKYDDVAVDRRIASMMHIDDFDALLARGPSGPPPIDPAIVAKLQIDKQNADTKAMQVQLDAQNADKDRQSRENMTALQVAAKHSADQMRNAGQQPGAQGGPQALNPLDVAALQLKGRQVDLQERKQAFDAYNAHAERQSRQTLEALKIAQAIAVHPTSDQVVDEQITQMAPFLTPTGDAGGSAGARDGGSMADGGTARLDDATQTEDGGRQSANIEDRRGDGFHDKNAREMRGLFSDIPARTMDAARMIGAALAPRLTDDAYRRELTSIGSLLPYTSGVLPADNKFGTDVDMAEAIARAMAERRRGGYIQ